MCYLHCNSCSNALSECLGRQTLFLSKLQRSIIVLSPKGAVVVFGSYSSWSSEEGSKYFCASTPMNFAFVLLIIHWVNPHLKLKLNLHIIIITNPLAGPHVSPALPLLLLLHCRVPVVPGRSLHHWQLQIQEETRRWRRR